MKLKRYSKNPILSPNPKNYWESLVTTNPGAYYDEVRKEVIMLYRAAGCDHEHRIFFGMAKSTNGYDFTRVSDTPVFAPSVDGFDAGCVEDPRIVKFGEYYYITYATRPFPPGQYWLEKAMPYKAPVYPSEFPAILRKNATSTGLAITRDFKSYIRAGRMTNPLVDDRDVILFPEKINGQFAMLHRPMDWVGEKYGTDYPAMWISYSDDMLVWSDSRLLAKAKEDWECKIGGNTPPIRTKYGWLTIYHGVGKDAYYRLGAFLLDLNDPSKVTHRTRDWILQPEEDFEINGCYQDGGVVFPCGKVVIGDTLFVYYGAADKYVGLATCPLDELLDYLRRCPV
ncbi:MAG: glycosidase [Phycisphaerae bacterium]|nr:glycosidase [Phycisphaerae bacterium]